MATKPHGTSVRIHKTLLFLSSHCQQVCSKIKLPQRVKPEWMALLQNRSMSTNLLQPSVNLLYPKAPLQTQLCQPLQGSASPMIIQVWRSNKVWHFGERCSITENICSCF